MAKGGKPRNPNTKVFTINCKICGPTDTTMSKDGRCGACHHYYIRTGNDKVIQAEWTVIAKGGRDITEEMVPHYKKMIVNKNEHVQIKVDRKMGRVTMDWSYFGNDPVWRKLKKKFTELPVLPHCELEGYVYCRDCWLVKRVIHWIVRPEKQHARIVDTNHDLCPDCRQTVSDHDAAVNVRRLEKVAENQKAKHEALSNDPACYVFPELLAAMDGVDAYIDKNEENDRIITKAGLVKAGVKAWELGVEQQKSKRKRAGKRKRDEPEEQPRDEVEDEVEDDIEDDASR